jgi:hypothetical protein
MRINGLNEYKMNTNGIIYKITAQTKILNYQEIKKKIIINKEDLVSKHIYYLNGTFETHDFNATFKKAYFLEGNFIMLDTFGNFNKNNFKSKKIIFKNTNIEFIDITINSENKTTKKLKYTININK